MKIYTTKEELRTSILYIAEYINRRADLTYDYALKSIASDPSTPPTVLKCIAYESSNAEVLERVAANRSTGNDVLASLATNADKDIRLAVANNHNANRITIGPLLVDESPTVRYILAENPYTDEFVLEKL